MLVHEGHLFCCNSVCTALLDPDLWDGTDVVGSSGALEYRHVCYNDVVR